jgi:hypothetical protein
MRTYRSIEEVALHPVSSFRERLDDKLPVLLAPSPHLLVGMNNRTNIIHDIFLLSTLIMERHAESCQTPKSSLYIDLGSTCDTYVKVWEAQANEVISKIENLFSGGWQAGIVGTLVKCVHDEVNGALNRK